MFCPHSIPQNTIKIVIFVSRMIVITSHASLNPFGHSDHEADMNTNENILFDVKTDLCAGG